MSSPSQAGHREFQRRLLVQTALRTAAITALLLATAILTVVGRDGFPLGAGRWLFGIVVAAYALILACALALRLRAPMSLVAYAQVTGDVGVAAAVVYVTGGSTSVFVFMFLLAVVNGSVLAFRRGAFIAAALSGAAFLTVAIALNVGAIPQAVPALASPPQSSQDLAFTLLANVSAFFLTAALASYVAEQLRAARERLSASEDDLAALTGLYEAIVDSVSSGIGTTDAAGRLSYLNPAAQEILGRGLDEVRGRPVEEVFGLSFDDAAVRPARGEVRIQVPSGTGRTLGYSVAALRKGLGGLVVAFQDLTSIRSMEEAVRRSERLSALGQMAAGLAHELRNPLGAMIGSIGLLSASDADAETQRLLDILRREAERLSVLVADFLAFARPTPAVPARLELGGFLRETVEVFAHDPLASGLSIAVDAAPAVVMADAGAVRRAVLNLLINAAQAVPACAGRVTVRLRRDGREAVVEIEDNGVGIAEAELSRIFDPFYSTKEHGTGLGLALAHAAIEANGGTLAVESRLGAGTTFRVRLPLAEGESPGAPAGDPTPGQPGAKGRAASDGLAVGRWTLNRLAEPKRQQGA